MTTANALTINAPTLQGWGGAAAPGSLAAAIEDLAEDVARALNAGLSAVRRALMSAARTLREHLHGLWEAARVVCRRALEILKDREVRMELATWLMVALVLLG